MNKIIEFIKNKKITILALVSLSFLIFIVVKINANKQNGPNTSTPISSPVDKIADFNEIIPGETSIERINELLGQPVESTISGNLNISDYKSANQYRYHKIYSRNGTAELIIEEIVNKEKSASDIQKVYGITPVVLFEKLPNSPFKLYLYPDNGIAYLGHQDGTVLEIWYFVPTNTDSFISRWGSNFSKEPSKEIQGY